LIQRRGKEPELNNAANRKEGAAKKDRITQSRKTKDIWHGDAKLAGRSKGVPKVQLGSLRVGSWTENEGKTDKTVKSLENLCVRKRESTTKDRV